MKIEQIWMSQDTEKKNRYGLQMLGGIVGIVVLALVLILVGTVVGFQLGLPMKLVSVILCLGVTAFMVIFAMKLGRKSVKDVTVFFLMEGDRLFVLDSRKLVDFGTEALSHAAAMVKIQKFLDRMARDPYLPVGADEIVKVERMKVNSTHYALVCRIRHPSGRVARRTYFLVNGLENQEQLLLQLQRRLQWASSPEMTENRNPLWIFLSALICFCFVSLCVMSHPAVGQFPQSIYFPCLGGAFVALCCAIWFGIRQHRGEL